MGEMIEIEALAGDGRFGVYCARPEGEPKAAIIVIQEIFGVNAGIRRKADDWAALGYLALAPDMFWRFAPGYDVDPDVPEQRQDAFGKIAQFDLDKAVADVEAVIRHARGQSAGGKVGIVGFCMGGTGVLELGFAGEDRRRRERRLLWRTDREQARRGTRHRRAADAALRGQ